MKTHRRMASAIRLHACNLLGSIKVPMGTIPKDVLFLLEQVRGIEPPCSAWEADILPLNYTCKLIA